MTLPEQLAKLQSDAAELLTLVYGEQCSDYVAGCPNCEARRALNEFARNVERDLTTEE